jgi:transcriptional regulator with XRE-family HTH domain
MTSMKQLSRRGGRSLIHIFAVNLRHARRSRRLSIAELARRCKYAPEYVRLLEEGRVPEVSLVEVEVLAQALGADLASLLRPNRRA